MAMPANFRVDKKNLISDSEIRRDLWLRVENSSVVAVSHDLIVPLYDLKYFLEHRGQLPNSLCRALGVKKMIFYSRE